ncbi:N-acetyltransferase [Deinococcus metallilatus]|uniref:GNAT family N-acetyltransferase n=1 Tax=Deinococcus metallilatus TaxID=1211322 RepID=A0AAJ5JXR9_9DEIO|nr:GNAT family N-acetyltransferase [Deinococcus metallilatus]MBB5296225.1 ribosomal protein S18 acetylase RimI-like enzyme [Deinococcus metallilatus]QBY09728.1 N-acetyltransferase [Deinococcus metallilatus]RXJ08926.1 N-acetyltransferase [Deinococcus metallilatus]TLK23695.1 GNAT family N-acetyltransferase [Deinococcus metallilatus]GMA14091.1 N-acetyltransferase [Deinococcus metallilatus]
MTFTVLSGPLPDLPELLALYASVGWTSYTRDPEALARAVRQSGFVWTARDKAGELLGLVRGVTDDVSILYVQDILVRPDGQRRGVGRALLEAVLERYAQVMQMVLLTDDGPGQLAFYRSLGFHNTRELVKMPTNAFYQDRRFKLS